MRRARLLALLLVAAGCSGGNDAPDPEATGLAVLQVSIVEQGQWRSAFLELRGGRLGAEEVEPSVRTVSSRAGAEPRDGIVWEEIYLREADGSERRLTNDRRADAAPKLLRDGRVAFVSCGFDPGGGPPDCSLDAIEPSSRSREKLLDDLGIVFHGELSPDEDRFLFTRPAEFGDPSGLFVKDLAGGPERLVENGQAGAWSPDGRRIAFVSDRDRNGPCLHLGCVGFAGEIYVADADGGNEVRLTESPQSDAAPAWSADGDWIVFARLPVEGGNWDLHAVRVDGACERRLTDTPRWEAGATWVGGGDGGLSC